MPRSKKYSTVKKYYDKGLWKIGAVRSAVEKGWITEDEFFEITGKSYDGGEENEE